MNVDRDRNMALKPSYNDKLYLPGLSNTEILILALEASQKLEWNIEEVTPEGIRLEVPFSIRSHGEAITFTIEKGSDGEVSVRSQSSSVQFVDYGKNRKNIQKLRETMEEIKASLTPEELAQRAKDFEPPAHRRRKSLHRGRKEEELFPVFLHSPQRIYSNSHPDRHQYSCIHCNDCFRSGYYVSFHSVTTEMGSRLRTADSHR